MRVVLVGADGFIGRHIAFALRDAGHEVIPVARRAKPLQAMGFADAVALELRDPAAHDPAVWRGIVGPQAALVWCAGLLTGDEAAFRAVHEQAPAAALAAMPPDTPALLISAVGIDGGQTDFARWRLRSEALFAGRWVLRPGLVLADTSYGGSSLIRALAALPLRVPVVGSGAQPFNPIHAVDLAATVAACLTAPPPAAPVEVGDPEVVTQAQMAQGYRRWLGLRAVPVLRLPLGLCRMLGRIGDALRLGPVSATAVAQLQAGVLARPAALPGPAPRGFSRFLMARPAGTQDLWQARLYLLKPLIRLVLAVMWLVSAGLGLFTPAKGFVPHLPGIPTGLAMLLARMGGLADLALGLALLRNLWPRRVAWAQIALVLAYTLGLGLMAPGLWLDPFGGLLKNLPILAFLAVHLALVEER